MILSKSLELIYVKNVRWHASLWDHPFSDRLGTHALINQVGPVKDCWFADYVRTACF